MVMKMKVMIFSLALLAAMPTQATVRVFACEPEWASLIGEIAGSNAIVYTATTAQQDPHYLQARPSLIAEIRDADLLVCSGAELEVGWLPLLLRRSGNRKIQAGQAGHFMAAAQVRRLEVPQTIDRSQGDIHPQGNPHVHLDPGNIKRIASKLAERLQIIDPDNAEHYRAAATDFLARWQKARRDWKQRAQALEGMRIVSHHRSFSYLANWLRLEVLANIERKPGISPSAAHLADLLSRFEDHPPALIIRTPYTDSKPSQWLSERLSAPARALPYTVGGGTATDLFSLFDETLSALEAVRP
jgi:zinc/manganese transport system substrate-binding protein